MQVWLEFNQNSILLYRKIKVQANAPKKTTNHKSSSWHGPVKHKNTSAIHIQPNASNSDIFSLLFSSLTSSKSLNAFFDHSNIIYST